MSSNSDFLNTDFDGADRVRTCTRKKAYPHEAAAKMSIRAIKTVSPDAEVRAYICRHCGSWHVGGVPGAPPSERPQRRIDAGRPRRGAQGEFRPRRRRFPTSRRDLE